MTRHINQCVYRCLQCVKEKKTCKEAIFHAISEAALDQKAAKMKFSFCVAASGWSWHNLY